MVGQHFLVKHLMREILKKNQPIPKDKELRDFDNVLNYLKGLPENKNAYT